MKNCTVCKESKQITEFYKDTSRSDGHEHRCKKCSNKKKHRRSAVRMQEDPKYRLREKLSEKVRDAVMLRKGFKSEQVMDLIGCTIPEMRQHLESKFTEGMSWDNYGQWHMDHIIAVSHFDLADIAQRKQCFHYTNTQPLWGKDNEKKSNHFTIPKEGVQLSFDFIGSPVNKLVDEYIKNFKPVQLSLAF